MAGASREQVEVRLLQESDSLEDLTALLHRAYRELLDRGLRYTATAQSVETTRERCSDGECYVAVADGRIVGTVTLYPPGTGSGCPWYERADVAHFGQFGVEPSWKGRGVGRAMLDMVENRARTLGAAHLALDTAKLARHLIELYERWGYSVVESVTWEEVNYESVIMSKSMNATTNRVEA